MQKRMFLGSGVALILAGMSGTVQAQTIFNKLWETGNTVGQIRLYDPNRHQLEQKPRPEKENPGHTGSKSDNKPKRHHSILDRSSG